MAKCKDCLHVELCANDDRLPGFTPEQEALCKAFLDRSRYVVREKGENLKADHPSLFECSKCGWFDWDTYTTDTGVYNFCPNCGADMRKGENG